MKNRTFGVIGISSTMANWNADFTGRPKTTSDGEIYGSDKALKYSIRKHMCDNGEKVLFFKSYKIDDKAKGDEKSKMQPRDLNERYEVLFGNKVDKKTPSRQVLKNLFSAVDVMNFGATFAVEGQNISITGAVQIGQGFNKFDNTNVEVQDILSPFRNSTKEDADASSLGKKIMVNKAQYFYSFSVNPKNYDCYVGLADDFEGYTREAYEVFKEGALVGATALNTCSKSGCENEFAMFVELKEDSKLILPNLDKYVKFENNVIDLTDMKVLSEEKVLNEIEKIEVYYNPYNVEVKQDIPGAALFNIYSREEIK